MGSPEQQRQGFVIGALEYLLFLPALDRLDPFFSGAAPIFRYERHNFFVILFFFLCVFFD